MSVGWLESGDNPGSVDLTLTGEQARDLLSLLNYVTVEAGIQSRLALTVVMPMLRLGLRVPEPAPALQRLLAGEEV